MRRLLVCLFTLVLVAGPGRARAGIEFSGDVLGPNPLTVQAQGLTEALGACNEQSDFQGVDGFWVHLPDGAEGRPVELVPADPSSDFDLYWYTEECDLIQELSMAGNGTGVIERGTVQPSARWAIVDLFQGAGSHFTLYVD